MRFDDDSAPLRETPPPDGVYALRAGVTCGRADHPRVILAANSFTALDRKEQRYRCKICQAHAFGVRPVPATAGGGP